jgi:hypothetical protein
MWLKPHVNRSAGQPGSPGTWYYAMFLVPGKQKQKQSHPRMEKEKTVTMGQPR